MSNQALFAFYDLEVSPISFDFSVFLILAEMQRRRSNHDELRVVIVPGTQDGFRAENTAYSTNNKRWRLYNIILPLTALLEQDVAIDLCTDRDAARELFTQAVGAVFPLGYTIDEPVADFFLSSLIAASARDEIIPSYRADPQASAYMAEWLESHTEGRKPVSITLRKSSYNETRNSNLDAWLEFARSLDKSVYCPVIVHDTEEVFKSLPDAFDNFLSCPIVSVNLQLRMALFEQSWLNLIVSNGTSELCRLSDRARYLYFKVVVEGEDSASNLLVASQGIEIGGQLPHASKFQRMIWKSDDADVIKQEFLAMAQLIKGDTPSIETSSINKAKRPPIETAVQLQMTGRFEEATSIYQDILQKDPENSDAWHFLAIIAQQAGQIEAAEKMIHRAINLNQAQSNYFVTLAQLEQDLGNSSKAIEALKTALSINPDDAGAYANLAELMFQAGERAQSESLMMRALQLAPATVEFYERAAKMLEKSDNIAEAVKFYQKAIEVREQMLATTRENTRHMSEIPQVSLGQR
jgi:tetratricopeptide (TPR) repeat protein